MRKITNQINHGDEQGWEPPAEMVAALDAFDQIVAQIDGAFGRTVHFDTEAIRIDCTGPTIMIDLTAEDHAEAA